MFDIYNCLTYTQLFIVQITLKKCIYGGVPVVETK